MQGHRAAIDAAKGGLDVRPPARGIISQPAASNPADLGWQGWAPEPLRVRAGEVAAQVVAWSYYFIFSDRDRIATILVAETLVFAAVAVVQLV